MDTLTHALVGAAVSDCWFRRRLGPMATPFALVLGALPDIDIVTYFVSPQYAWTHHRGYTHSLFLMLLAAPLFGCSGYLLSRKNGKWLWWMLLALIALFLHTVFDLITGWGTMPLLPFSTMRISWDIAPVLDVFVFAITASAFLINRILRWERVETFLNPLLYPVVYRHPKRQRAGDWIGVIAVILLASYLLVGWRQNRQTVRIAEKELAAAGIAAIEVRAIPLMFTYIAWGVVARDSAGTLYNAVYSSYEPKPMRFVAFPSASGAEVERVQASDAGIMFAWYSQGLYAAEVTKEADGKRVRFVDRRFYTLGHGYLARFAVEFDQNAAGEITGFRPSQMSMDKVDIRDELKRLWHLTRYGDTVRGEE